MSKFVIECPNCGKFAEGKTGFFARKKIDCACGHTINVRTDKMTGRECPPLRQHGHLRPDKGNCRQMPRVPRAYQYHGRATCKWMLRTPGRNSFSAAIVLSNGSVFDLGDEVDRSNVAVRPAMWIDLGA